MATGQFIHDGKAIDYTPGSAVSAGDVVVQGDLIGVAKLDIAADALGALAVDGVFDFPKASGASTAITAGAKVYWDAGDSEAKEDAESGANKYLGKVVAAAADADTTVRVRMEQ